MTTIKIIDSAGIEQMLAFDFRQRKETIKFSSIRQFLSRLIDEQLILLEELFKDVQEKNITFSLEQQNKKKPNMLACFMPELSLKDELRFSIYYQTVQEIYEHLIIPSEEFVTRLINIIIHELVHALDLKVLLKDVKVHTENYNKMIKEREDHSSFQVSDNSFAIQSSFISFLRTFRNEGVAILGEKIFGSNIKASYSKEDSFKYFRQDFRNVLSLCESIQCSNNRKISSINDIVSKISSNAYHYADIIILNILQIKFPEQLDYNRFYKLLHKNPEGDSLTLDQKTSLLKIAFELDLSEYIQGILALKDSENNYLIDHKEFYYYCGILQKELNNTQIITFINGIIDARLNRDPEKFISTLKELLGYPMTKEEIDTLFNNFKSKEYTEDIVQDIIRMAKYLTVKLKEENSQIAIWALTYLLDDEDIIHDNLSYLGFQDDWIVLNCGCMLEALVSDQN